MRVAVAAWRFIWSICRSHSGRGIRSGNDHSAESAHQQLLIGHHVVDQRTAADAAELWSSGTMPSPRTDSGCSRSSSVETSRSFTLLTSPEPHRIPNRTASRGRFRVPTPGNPALVMPTSICGVEAAIASADRRTARARSPRYRARSEFCSFNERGNRPREGAYIS